MSDKSNPAKQPSKGTNNFIPAPQQTQLRQNNNNNLNNMRPPPQAAPQQPQQQPASTNNLNNNAINRPGSSTSGIMNQHNDFMTFLNSGNPISNNISVSNSPNANALSRLETIRQYYMQLSNNLRLITQQLQSPDLTASRRQALLMEQARANAAMQDFTEKILKPISASKQQQQQAQAQAQAQLNNQRPPNYANNGNVMQYPNRPPHQQLNQHQQQSTSLPAVPQQVPQIPMKPNSGSTAPSMNYQPRPPPQNVNLYSQSGLGMIRPIINAPPRPPGVNMNFRPQPPSMTSPQRPFRPQPPTTQSAPNSASPMIGTPLINTKPQQQFMINRQTYLIAAQHHQTSVAQQQVLFQQRLSLFSRDPINSSPPSLKRSHTSTNANILNVKRFKPVLALPPPAISNIKPINGNGNGSSLNPNQMQSKKLSNFPTTIYPPNLLSKSSSFPSSYPNQIHLTDLAKQFNLNLTKEAEGFLLRIADEFIDNLARKSFTFALHRKKKIPAVVIAAAATTVKSSSKKQQPATPIPLNAEDEELTLTVEDLILGLDEVINYQPAGNGSIENCRPLIRKPVSNVDNSAPSSNTTNAQQQQQTTNHQHRLNLVKKHSSLYQYY